MRIPIPLLLKIIHQAILREQGIDVIHYPIQAISDFYRSYHYWTLTRKPRVTVKMAQTLDGKIAGSQGRAFVFI